MKYLLSIVIFLFLSHPIFAKENRIIDQIRSIEKSKYEETIKNEPEANLLMLSNGGSVDLNQWLLVTFINSTCSHCQKFDPILKKVSDDMKINTFIFSFDGLGDSSFPNVYPVTDEIVASFYRDLPVATPTVFLVNINDLRAAAISQGEMPEIAFKNQIIKTFISLRDEE